MRSAAILFAGMLTLAVIGNVQSGVDPQFRNATEDGDAIQRKREAAFHKAVGLYREHSSVADWRARVTIDRWLSKEAAGMPVRRLEEFLLPDDPAMATAVAVCLGDSPADDSARQTVRLFDALLASPYDRVRYRAAESIIQRLAEDTLDQTGRELLLPVVHSAIATEEFSLNLDSLNYAKHLLTESSPIWGGK
jgi:hypothetical protein